MSPSGTAQFLGDAVERGIDGQAGLGADDQQVERVGQALADGIGALVCLVLEESLGPLVPGDDQRGEGHEALEAAPFREGVGPVEHDHADEAEHDRQNHAREDDEDGQFLVAEARLRQLLLDDLDL
ncbi:MAG: hypothetical protein ACM32J_14990, partial [Rhizobacter sp.]